MGTLIAPGEHTALEVYLLQEGFIEKSTELTHPPSIQPAIVFIFGHVNHIEVST
jgi:hypothetical protein